jgi:uncharacterized membrane protein YhfC
MIRRNSVPSTFHISPAWVAADIIAITFVILYPLVLAVVAHRRLKVGWKYFAYGALIFFVFQLITRVPAVIVIQAAIAPQLEASPALLYTWLAILALTAGLFEEVGRYVAFRWLMRREEKTWNKAVMYGLGHGGLESILLVGGLALLSLINIIVLSSIGLNSIPLAQRAQAAQQLAALAAQPAWFPLLAAWERLWTVPVQIALSVLVLQVFRRNNIGWLWLAILAHAIVDGVSVGLIQVLGPGRIGTSLIAEVVVAIFGVIALWIIFALRDHPTMKEASEAQSLPPPAEDDVSLQRISDNVVEPEGSASDILKPDSSL